MSHLYRLKERNLVHPNDAVLKGTYVYEVIMGSRAYGCYRQDSDYDMYGIVIPQLQYVFPHRAGIIHGFGHNPYQFEQFRQEKILDNDKEYSFNVYSIVRMFDLLLGCNPNIIEVLFVPQEAITHITTIGHKIRNSRHLFLSKLYVEKMRSYSISQMKKAENRNPTGKREELVNKFGFDTKSAQNLIRLAYQTEQVLLEGDLTLNRHAKTLLAIRNGEWSLDKIKGIFDEKNEHIEGLILKSELRAKPDENVIKNLLLECLEIQYGKLTNEVTVYNSSQEDLKKIYEIAKKYKD